MQNTENTSETQSIGLLESKVFFYKRSKKTLNVENGAFSTFLVLLFPSFFLFNGFTARKAFGLREKENVDAISNTAFFCFFVWLRKIIMKKKEKKLR